MYNKMLVKLKTSHLFLILILVFLIFLTISNSCVHFKPYDASQFQYANYESFQSKEGLGGINTGTAISTEANKGSLFSSLTTASAPSASIVSATESFLGLESSPYVNEKSLDVFSGTPGSINCDGISSNLSNSKGGLCLSDKQQTLLRTRGGNASGGNFQIGA
jgi:hypothetical protein